MSWRSDFDWTASEGGAGADGEPPAEYVDAFVATMPSRYRVLFDPRAIRRHAAVVRRRGKRAAYAEVWRSLADGSAAFCVVAEDRPGLLSAIAAALVSHRLDVLTALVFSRVEEQGGVEAVDFLWVRRADPLDTSVIDGDEVGSVAEVLSAILAGTVSVADIALRSTPAPTDDEALVRVAYDSVDDDGRAVLQIEAPDRPGMLLVISRELFQQGAQIVRSLVRTSDGRAYNRFELSEFSGLPLSADRREQVRAAVLATLAFGEASIVPR